MSDWEEVKRLAADFQKVQLSSNIQKLSERNCIEIITWLTQKKLIELIFTVDGKEYLTPAQLITEINNQLYMSGGRANLVELAKSIGVDINHINAHLSEVLRGQSNLHCVLGQLVDSTYLVRIADEINQRLVQNGQININDLTIQYDLPADFLQQHVVERYMGKSIFGQQDRNDPRVFFTDAFVARTRAKIRGALVGLTKPTPVTALLNQLGVSDKLFFSLFDQVCTHGTLTSRMTAAQYIPHIYSRSQHEWTSNFYKQNNYLEYDALSRLGIVDYKSYLRKQFPEGSGSRQHHLNSCMVSHAIIERIEADIEEAIISRSYLDLQASLPSVLNDADIQQIVALIVKQQKQRETVVLGNVIVSQTFVDRLAQECESTLEELVKAAVESGKYQQYHTEMLGASAGGKSSGPVREDPEDNSHGGSNVRGENKRDERRKKATGGKSGGGTQGRETKTKSTKRQGGAANRGGAQRHDNDSDDEHTPDSSSSSRKPQFAVIQAENVRESITGLLEEEGVDYLMDDLVAHLLPTLQASALSRAAKLFAATVTDRTSSRRETHNDIQTKLNNLLGDIRLFDKGVKQLSADVQPGFYKYLLKTLCTDVLNELLNYVAAEEGHDNVNAETLSSEQRTRFINELRVDYRASMQALAKTLNAAATSVDDFNAAAEAALAACSMIVKKVDKKKDRLLILNHKHGLLEQLGRCDDAALTLHLAVLVLFVSVSQCMVHASGKFVVTLLTFLKPQLTSEHFAELMNYHDLVMLSLTGSGDDAVRQSLQDKMSVIKDITNNFKKPALDKH